jgi:hypothetical protein
MAEDPNTRSLFLCVMDGHGEDGDKVSQHIKKTLVTYLFAHRAFESDVRAALRDVIAQCEAEVLRGELFSSPVSNVTRVRMRCVLRLCCVLTRMFLQTLQLKLIFREQPLRVLLFVVTLLSWVMWVTRGPLWVVGQHQALLWVVLLPSTTSQTSQQRRLDLLVLALIVFCCVV